MSKLHRDNAGYVGCSFEGTQDPYYSYNKLALPLAESDKTVVRDEVTFTVTVAGGKFVIDGTSQATVSLLEGNVYTFDQSDNSNTSHPLKFSYTADGTHGGGSEFTLGVTTNGTPGQSGAYTRIVVPFGLHDLKYYCGNHSGMGGSANVVKNTKAFTVGRPILKTTDAFGKTLGSGNNADPYAANLVLALPMAPGRDYTSEGSTSGSFYSSAGGAASKMFDGDANTGAFSQTGTSTYTFGGTTITATTSVQIRAFKGDAAGANVEVNGTDVSSSLNAQSSGGYSTVDVTTTLGGAPITLSSVSVVNAGGGSGNIAQIFVDGVELIDETFSRDVSAAIRGTGSAKDISIYTGSASGGAVNSTAQSQFYGSSFYTVRGGTNNYTASDYIYRTGDTDLAFGTGDFTVEFWFQPESLVSNCTLFDNRHESTDWPNSTAGFQFFTNAAGDLYFRTGSGYPAYATALLSEGVWSHIAITREAGTIKLFHNGTLVGSASNSNDFNEGRFHLGSSANNGEGSTGYYADLRIYKGIAKYTTPFPIGSYGMDAVTYTGNGGSQTISGLNFQPDLVWTSVRDSTGYIKYIFDSVRGATKALSTSHTQGDDAETTLSTGLTSFNSNGFTLGSNSQVNENNRSMVAWGWKAGGATTTDNVAGAGNVPTAGAAKIDGENMTTSLAGTIPATRLTASTKYGFSIVAWEGNGTSGETVAHGITNATPKMVWFKNRDTATTDWRVYNTMVDGSLDFLFLNTNADKTDSSLTTFTSTTFTVGGSSESNGTGDSMIAYVFCEVSGYSSLSSFEGTGNAGVSVTTGFKPRWVMIKEADNAGNWFIYDTQRGTSNILWVNTNNSESSIGAGDGTNQNAIEVNDSGFTIPHTLTGTNRNGSTYIYAAFAESAAGEGFESHLVEQLGLDDLSGNSNNASNSGATFQTSIKKFYDGAAEFNTSNSGSNKITATSSDFAFGTGDFTIEAWIYVRNHKNYNCIITTRLNNGGFSDAWHIGLQSGGELIFYGASMDAITSAGAVKANQWTHVAAAKVGTTLTLYIDGSPKASDGSFSRNLTRQLMGIGQFPSANVEGFDGYIQDVRIYKGIAKYTSSFSPPERSVQGTARRYPSGVYVVS